MATLDTEIRKLQPKELFTLGQILNHTNAWKKLMAIIPKEDNDNDYMFNNEHVTMIEEAIRQQRRSGADIFLSEWSTLNKKRPTCGLMLDLLVKAELFRAADYLAVEVLKRDPPERPKTGPAAAVDISDQVLEELLKMQAQNAKAETETPENPGMEWSFHFIEKPIDAIGSRPVSGPERPQELNEERSDLMKFSDDRSDLIKFSSSGKEIENLPRHLEIMTKLNSEKSAENSSDKSEAVGYVLEEALSADLPLCVKQTYKPISKVTENSSMTENWETLDSIESTDVSRGTAQGAVTNEQIELPNISQGFIPVVVMEYNEK